MSHFDLLHDVVPGRHFYQFYKSQNDLLQVLVSYWKAGIEKNNFCFWVVPYFLSVENARQFLSDEIPQFRFYEAKGGFELEPHVAWYGDGDTFDGDLVAKKYIDKMKEVLSRGFQIIRIAGDTSGLKPHVWPELRAYERKGHALMKDLTNVIALCSYPLHRLSLQETKDVLDSHHGVLVVKV